MVLDFCASGDILCGKESPGLGCRELGVLRRLHHEARVVVAAARRFGVGALAVVPTLSESTTQATNQINATTYMHDMYSFVVNTC